MSPLHFVSQGASNGIAVMLPCNGETLCANIYYATAAANANGAWTLQSSDGVVNQSGTIAPASGNQTFYIVYMGNAGVNLIFRIRSTTSTDNMQIPVVTVGTGISVGVSDKETASDAISWNLTGISGGVGYIQLGGTSDNESGFESDAVAHT